MKTGGRARDLHDVLGKKGRKKEKRKGTLKRRKKKERRNIRATVLVDLAQAELTELASRVCDRAGSFVPVLRSSVLGLIIRCL